MKSLVLVSLLVLMLYQIMPTGASQSAVQAAKVELFLNTDEPLRGHILIVTGRLSSVSDNFPIPLVSVKLEYIRIGDTNPTREVSMITSSPGGIFQDLVNTTYLLSIGTWIVNASFPAQLIYQSTSAAKSFTIVVQPALSIYVHPNQVTLGQEVDFNGLLFACIPCLDDHVSVVLIRPNNTAILVHLKLNATGGPYPGGYYAAKFVPDVPGLWHIMTIWQGNNVTLPTNSTIEELNVEAPGTSQLPPPPLFIYLIPVVAVLMVAILLMAFLKRRDGKKPVPNSPVA
jgi:hypothetical protein